MKTSSVFPAVLTAALIASSMFAANAMGQAPAGGPPPGGGTPGGPRTHPAPTNLQVLPKTTTGEQVHEIMEKWSGSLGVHCNTCHMEDTKNPGPNGRPRLNFADDSKPQKATARKMFAMTEGINKDYIMKVEGADEPVACGTCHRGHLDPQPYVIPEEHKGPQGGNGGGPGGAPPPAGAAPSAQP